jgi:large subunit ribosomal protein L31
MAKEKKTTTKKTSNKEQATKAIAYYDNNASCVCGAEFETGSTSEKLRVDICSNCHPFFTGDNRILDTEGRVEKFLKKYNLEKK